MRQFQLNFWNGFKKIFCYHSGLRKVNEHIIKPWKRYDRLIDISLDEMKDIIKREKIKTLILDMDGTLKHYKLGLLPENRIWVEEIKKNVKVYVISNANKELTSKVADELQVEFIHNAKKPSSYGFNKICEMSNAKKDEIIVIGDAIRSDIRGAENCGIKRTILLNDLNIMGVEQGSDKYEKYYYIAFNLILYSFLGWIIEMVYHIGKGIYENRGFLTGPFCLIYGINALIMIVIHSKIRCKNKMLKIIIFWIYVFLICSVFEYLTSYFIEFLFDIRLWDYTGLSFNIAGRIRLITSIAWANCSILLLYVIHPLIDKLFNKLTMFKGYSFYIILHIISWVIFIDWILSILKYSNY